MLKPRSKRHRLHVAVFLVGIGTAACTQPTVKTDSSILAVVAHSSTLAIGSDCFRPLELGYSYCPLRSGEFPPKLRILFMHAAEYAVSDCMLGIHATGATPGPGSVEVDISKLSEQIEKQKFCFLKIEAVEHFADPNAAKQMHTLQLTAGFFIESLPAGYFPTPSPAITTWCYKVSQTSKGRTRLDACN